MSGIRNSQNAGSQDASTGAASQVSYEHHEIHGGSSFSAHFDNTTANADDARTAIGFKTPNTTKFGHLVVQITASSPAELSILEAPTIDNDAGTQSTIFNRNRNSAKESTMVDISAAPTAGKFEAYIEAELATLAGGTTIEHIQLAGGEGPKAVGGNSRGSQEWILKANTIYIIVLQNIGANINLHEIHLDWYEHTDKN